MPDIEPQRHTLMEEVNYLEKCGISAKAVRFMDDTNLQCNMKCITMKLFPLLNDKFYIYDTMVQFSQ